MLDCLMRLKPYAEIIVFTASHVSYADVILDFIDPKKEIFDFRLYRQHCVVSPETNLYIKDLRILKDRDLKDVVLIDNATYSFGC